MSDQGPLTDLEQALSGRLGPPEYRQDDDDYVPAIVDVDCTPRPMGSDTAAELAVRLATFRWSLSEEQPFVILGQRRLD